jgi:2-oxoglutarate ferredoxin oxidoreductase subunit alpha
MAGHGRVFWQGNEAIAEGAIRAGVRFFAGYPITPATEVAEHMAVRLPEVDGTFIQMEDEIASMAAVVGASLAGAKSMTASSGPGMSLKQENIGMAAMQEVPCVIVDVMRVGPATGMATFPAQQDVMQARWGTHGDRAAIALCPSSVAECYELTIRAVNLAERFRMPVHLLADSEVGHMREAIEVPREVEIVNRRRPRLPAGDPAFQPYAAPPDGVPDMADFGAGYRWHAEASTHNVRGDLAATDHSVAEALHRRLVEKVSAHAAEITYYSERKLDDAEVAIVSYGISARSSAGAVELARADGVKVGLLNLNTLWPFPEELVGALSGRVKAIFVAELNAGQVVREVERAVRGRTAVYHIGRYDGQILSPAFIVTRIKEVLGL